MITTGKEEVSKAINIENINLDLDFNFAVDEELVSNFLYSNFRKKDKFVKSLYFFKNKLKQNRQELLSLSENKFNQNNFLKLQRAIKKIDEIEKFYKILHQTDSVSFRSKVPNFLKKITKKIVNYSNGEKIIENDDIKFTGSVDSKSLPLEGLFEDKKSKIKCAGYFFNESFNFLLLDSNEEIVTGKIKPENIKEIVSSDEEDRSKKKTENLIPFFKKIYKLMEIKSVKKTTISSLKNKNIRNCCS